MPALRHLSIGIVALLGVLLAGVWLVPPWLDWNRYRGDVARLATAALGQQVRIDGPISLRLLPQPLLIAGGVSVAEGAAGATVTADELRLRVALGPLLAGRVDARELVLRRADIRLPWPLDPAALALRTPSWLSSLSARIEDGRLRVGEVEVSGIEATLATNDVSGSFVSAGRGRIGGREWVFTARVSRPGGDGAVGVDVTLDGQGEVQGMGAVVSGQMQPDGTMLGRIAARGPDMSQLLPAPSVPFRGEGRLSVGGGLVAADEMVGEIAGSPVQGAVALRLSPRLRLDVAVTASRLDLDAWAPALLRGARGGSIGWLPVGIDLSAEAAVLGGGTVRALRGAFDVGDGVVVVREVRAVLPGEAALTLAGRIALAGGGQGGEGGQRFAGQGSLTAPALRTTLDWAAAAWAAGNESAGAALLEKLPPGVLRTAQIAAAVVVEPGMVALSEVAGRVDGAALAANLTLRTGVKPSLVALVALDRLELDPWLPVRWPGIGALATGLGAFALDLKLEAERAAWRGVEIAKLSLDLAGEPGRLLLRRLEARALGAVVSLAGTLMEGGRVADARLEVQAARADSLAVLFSGRLDGMLAGLEARVPALLRGGLVLQAQAGGAAEALGIMLTATLGDIRVEATPTLNLGSGAWAGALTLRHPGAPRLAEMLGLAGAPAWLGDGSFALVAQLAGGPAFLSAEQFDLAAGGLRAAGSLRLDGSAVPRLSGRVVAEALPLPLPYARAPDPLPVAFLSGWEAEVRLEAGRVLLGREKLLDDASATLSLAGGTLRLDGLTGRMGGGVVNGALRFEAGAKPPALALDVTVAGAIVSAAVLDAPIDIIAGTVDVAVQLQTAGFSPAGMLAGLSGKVRVQGRDGVVSGFELARMGPRLDEADLRAAVSDGTTAFERLDIEAQLQSGALTLARAAMAGPAGTATATGTVDLTRAVLALRLALVPTVPEPPEIGLRVTGPVDDAERVPELAEAVRWRAEHPP